MDFFFSIIIANKYLQLSLILVQQFRLRKHAFRSRYIAYGSSRSLRQLLTQRLMRLYMCVHLAVISAHCCDSSVYLFFSIFLGISVNNGRHPEKSEKQEMLWCKKKIRWAKNEKIVSLILNIFFEFTLGYLTFMIDPKQKAFFSLHQKLNINLF